ncbi:MAG: aminotransferase class I/II-fold pyridoxal phosphate-dependent enzyme [Clostridiales Family XIII bacterium]|jgi:O-acetylhomoserine (thiol)-lyase|nr:aminotransferase class I/II-fold pyridoxal phosphate-dependent enzyme [Clostridiales Family XIII bacterium]
MVYSAWKNENLGFGTRQLHAGYDPSSHNGAKAVPIYQDAAFQLGDFDRGGRLFSFAEDGYSYGRYSNPTTEALERRLESLEGSRPAAVAMASGMAAAANTFLNIAVSGDELVASSTLYGGNLTLLKKILPQYGIRSAFVRDENDPSSYAAAITDRTKAIFVECLGNPNSNIVDFEPIAEVAHSAGIPLIVDNTFATPYLFRPFEHGADIVTYSATKYLSGHGILIGGAVVDRGGFDWLGSNRYPHLEKFYEENSEAIDGEKLRRFLFSLRLRMTYLCDLGSYMSPQTAFYILQGLETLSLRMERHVANAKRVAEFLDSHKNVLSVSYPSLESSPYRSLAEKYFPRGAGAIVSFRPVGGLDAAKRIIERCELFDFMANVGDAKSLIVHAATSTHFGQPAEALEAAGVAEDTIRLSIGIEDADDLIADLGQALE